MTASTLAVCPFQDGLKNSYLEFAFLDGDSTHGTLLSRLQKDWEGLVCDFRCHNLTDQTSTLYYYSVRSKDAHEFLTRAKEFVACVDKVLLLGSARGLADVAKHFDPQKVKVEERYEPTKGLKALLKLEHFALASAKKPDAPYEDELPLEPLRNLSGDMLVVSIDAGVTYYYMPAGDAPAKFLGHSPIGTDTLTTMFRLCAKNLGPYSKGYNDARDAGFFELLNMTKPCHGSKCDMLVYDITGPLDPATFPVPLDIPASRFGNIQTPTLDEVFKKAANGGNPGDKLEFATSLVLMLVENISHHTELRAVVHKCHRYGQANVAACSSQGFRFGAEGFAN